jgi:hypothetical protein
MKRIPLLLLLLVTACVPAGGTTPRSAWQHAGTPAPLQLERDLADCHMYLSATQDDSSMSPPHRTVREWDDEFVACMAERGWKPR